MKCGSCPQSDRKVYTVRVSDHNKVGSEQPARDSNPRPLAYRPPMAEFVNLLPELSLWTARSHLAKVVR